MIRLPSSLERRLQMVFPKAKEREAFVAEVVEKALVTKAPSLQQPVAVGGTLHLFTDGGARGNPGQAAVGIVLMDPLANKVLREYAESIGIVTNNIAEYRALITGMTIAKEYAPNHLICHLDSELVVKQLNGEYRVKMKSFEPLIAQLAELKTHFPQVSFVYIPREQNLRADMLLNRALDEMKTGAR